MRIDFGNIKSYNSDRGFGFISGTFVNPHGKVFFHIKKIKAKNLEVAHKLDNGENFSELNLWYEMEKTQKGEQVKECWLDKNEIPENYANELSSLILKVENIWKNIDLSEPNWLDSITLDLVGASRKHELSLQRDKLKSQRKKVNEKWQRIIEATQLKQIKFQQEKESQEIEYQTQVRVPEQETIQRLIDKYNVNIDEARELYQLLEEMRPKGFTYSNQLSKYIVRHKLGYKYKHISGILKMELEGDQWDFDGGFPPHIYSIICQELKLGNQKTKARPGTFTPYKSILFEED
ncbi:cold-shock protein (plasmid) [Cyanobacterium sp. IPPAS B-1200]|uniref:cold-shock protein n=1 Tax=Cyanobacterium sp. IPPAS B-1200 TaxID=1562720 RepID=UPI0008526FAF|nr:cold shock domain-containing protein [Cyanobacterium sp. IPPAS B-1200]OEJ80012.1 cold-shock protein [Cyanobacterium sp. IPPAS B-1200]